MNLNRTQKAFLKKTVYGVKGRALVEQTYPSGRKVVNELDVSGDLARVKSRKNSSQAYWNCANHFTYNAADAVTSVQLGNGRWESTTFNSRLQPTQIALGMTAGVTDLLDLDYTYGTTANNGNVLSQAITVSTVGATPGFTAVQNYSYDSLNRLQQAGEKPHGWTDTNCASDPTKCWKQTFTFDRYGNRRFVEADTTMPASFANQAETNPTISPTTNKLTATGWSYDPSGNTKTDPSGRSFVYDAENKQTSVTDGSGTIGQYFYDGGGRRVKKHVPSTGETTVFVYDAGGKHVAEYSTVVASVQDAKVAYLTNDHLGSPRINTDATGRVTSRHDYHPFGEEVATSYRVAGLKYNDDSIRKQFTGYERDPETELDFAQSRMYAARLGRFTSVDPIKMKRDRLIDPQRINLYCYARNAPYTFVDISGADLVLAKNLKAKERDFVVKTLARLYMTKAGRAEIEKANDARFVATVGSGNLENRELKPAGIGETNFGGKIKVVGGDTKIPYNDSLVPGKKTMMAQETGAPESAQYLPVAIRVDKGNAEDMGKDAAGVAMHELRHFNNAVDEANKPDPAYPGYPGNDLSGLDEKKDEKNAQAAEKEISDLPEEPSQEAVQAVERILKTKKEEKELERPK